MKDLNGTHYCVTPSILYSTDSATLAIDGGDGGLILMKRDGKDFDGEASVDSFMYRIYDTNGELFYSDVQNALTTLIQGDPLGALHAVISFLTACAESKSEESENYTLFPTSVREWAEMYSDELTMISLEIEEERDMG